MANKSETSDQQKVANVLIGLQDQSESHILNPSLEDDSDSDSSLEAYNQFLRNNFNDMSQITGTQSLHQSQVMGVNAAKHDSLPVLEEDRPLQLDHHIKIEESKFGQVQPAQFHSYHNPGASKDSSSFDHTNVNNISSFGGSFMNLGRASDMNEDRIISKETQEARLRAPPRAGQKTVVVNQKHVVCGDHTALNQECGDISKIEKNQSIGAVLEASTSELDNIANDITNSNHKSKIVAQQTHFSQYRKHSTSAYNSKLHGGHRAALHSNNLPNQQKLNSIMMEHRDSSAADENLAGRDKDPQEQYYSTNTNKNKGIGDDSEIFMPSQYNTTFDHKPGPSGSSEHLTNIQRIGYILGGHGDDMQHLQSR